LPPEARACCVLRLAHKRGYIISNELNDVLPSEEFTPEQIENVLGQLSEMEITMIGAEKDEESQSPLLRRVRRKASRTALSWQLPARSAGEGIGICDGGGVAALQGSLTCRV
jgi:hypothetical protein